MCGVINSFFAQHYPDRTETIIDAFEKFLLEVAFSRKMSKR